ncbi:MAG: hemerythrin domain-containing protein [Polyangiaceae bacterium]
MDALFANLDHEHRTIREIIDAFERYLALAAQGDARARAADLPRFLVFFREYVDLVHHEREERVLLPALARHGFAPGFGPSAHVKEQHRHERHLLHEVYRWGFRPGGCPADDPELQRLAKDLIKFQRTHLEKEEQFLYPAAKKELKDEAGLLKKEVADFDAEQDNYGRRPWLERMVGELATLYGQSG